MAEQARILNGQLHLGGPDDADIFIADKTTEKVGFHGASPVVQRSGSSQDAAGTATTVGGNTGTAGAGLSAIGDTASVDQSAALMNDLVALQEDIEGLTTLVNELRAALTEKGVIKGSS